MIPVSYTHLTQNCNEQNMHIKYYWNSKDMIACWKLKSVKVNCKFGHCMLVDKRHVQIVSLNIFRQELLLKPEVGKFIVQLKFSIQIASFHIPCFNLRISNNLVKDKWHFLPGTHSTYECADKNSFAVFQFQFLLFLIMIF